MSMSSTLRQIGAVSMLNLANLPKRWVTSLVAIVGIAGVVMVTVGLLSVAEGFSLRDGRQDSTRRHDTFAFVRHRRTGQRLQYRRFASDGNGAGAGT